MIENTGKTLANVISPQQGQVPSTQGVSHSYNTFLNVFTLNLVYRFPDVTDLNTIDYATVRQIAEFSEACTRIGLEFWEEISVPQTGRRMLRPSRTA